MNRYAWFSGSLGAGVLSFVVAACGSTVEHEGGASSTSTGTGGTKVTSSSSGSSTTDAGTSGGSVTGVTGGVLDTLNFVIVGDTRPPNEDDTAGYPTAVITKIWQEVEAYSPRPAFSLSTGDYMYANPTTGTQQVPQVDLYLGARAAFTNVSFPAMGNHECTGETNSNCGAGNADGITPNYTTFMTKMLAPLGVTQPYYTVTIASSSKAWTAKLVFVAANAWDTAQSTWLEGELAKPTTYTFVIRHESVSANTAPGVTPSEAIMAKYPYTLAIVGHTHTYSYSQGDREVIVGNGGAPLSSGSNYGYVVAQQRADGAIVFNSIDYLTNAVTDTFAVTAAGAPTQ
jgi:hypothetical protein